MDRILSEEQYAVFTENDFLADAYFQEWIIHPDSDNTSFWTSFLVHYPQKREEVENARRLLANLSFKQELPTDEMIEQSLQKHLTQIRLLEDEKVVQIDRSFYWRKTMRVAAMIGGIVLLLATFIIVNKLNQNKDLAVATDFGELDSLTLPDLSKVVLNANSRISYDKEWNKGKLREVWLEGEAFFDVKHYNVNEKTVAPEERFIVHTEDLDVEVLGTAFNIRQRRGRTEVVLQTGKIKVHFKNDNRSDLIMNPGDIITYHPEEKELNKSVVKSEEYTAWKEKKLILHNPTVDEIVSYLEDNYGKRIVLQTKDLGKRQLYGPILLNNLDDALFILSTVYNMEVIRNADSTIVLRARN